MWLGGGIPGGAGGGRGHHLPPTYHLHFNGWAVPLPSGGHICPRYQFQQWQTNDTGRSFKFNNFSEHIYDRNSNMTGVPRCCSGLLTSECEDGMLYSYTVYIQQVGITYYRIMTNAWMEIYSQKVYRTIIIILLVSSTLLDHKEKPHVGQLGRPQPTDYSEKSLQRHQQCHLKGGSKDGISS